MEKKERKQKSNFDGLALSILSMVPDGAIKGIVQISHGMSEHKERYLGFMEFLAQNGYASVIHDHRGHGESVKSKDDFGYFYDTKAEGIVEDLKQITDEIRKQYPDKPIILFGHSMGSMVVRKYIKKYDDAIDQLIVCGSPSRNRFVGLAIGLVKFQTLWKGDHYRSQWIQNLIFSSNPHDKSKLSSPNDWICSDEKTVEQYESCEKCGFLFTLNGFQNLFTLLKEIYSRKGWEGKNKDLPIFFIAGADDPIILSKQAWLDSQEFLRKRGYPNIQNKLYPNMRHEILNENGKEQVYQDILDWIEKNQMKK